ncbi:hypothetical protein Hdeb2414_s0002g00056881 [Helianthus debilis subsp. tardiflorus]
MKTDSHKRVGCRRFVLCLRCRSCSGSQMVAVQVFKFGSGLD